MIKAIIWHETLKINLHPFNSNTMLIYSHTPMVSWVFCLLLPKCHNQVRGIVWSPSIQQRFSSLVDIMRSQGKYNSVCYIFLQAFRCCTLQMMVKTCCPHFLLIFESFWLQNESLVNYFDSMCNLQKIKNNFRIGIFTTFIFFLSEHIFLSGF